MKKIIVVTPDQFLDLYRNLSHCHVQFSSPGVERLSLETSVYASLNDGNFTESTQLTKCAF